MDFLHFIFSSFGVFIGFWILVSIPVELVFKTIKLFVRRSNIKARGWPPAHLDADGDFKKEPENKK
jgi:hypothetical protein